MTRASIAAVGLIAVAAACGRSETQTATGPPETTAPRSEITLSPAQQTEAMITTATISPASATEVLRASGRIALPDTRTWRVGVRTNGIASAVAVGVGDAVHGGQLLARYHADEVRDTRARYRQANQDLEQMRSAETLAQRNAMRADTLLDLKAASQQQVDQARQDLAMAHASTRAAEIEVERLRHVLEHDLQVKADTGTDDAFADEVPIFAPASGYILERNISPGRAIHTDDDVFVIGDLSQVWMLAEVRQEQLGALRVGDRATVTVPGVGMGPFVGTIANLGQQLDPMTRVMQVRIVLDNAAHRLRPEMLATAEISVGATHAQLLVPSDAIQQVNDQDVVFVRTAADRFAVRPVRVGDAIDGRVAVLDGLKGGEEVVITGSFVLKSQLLRAAIEE
jgi:cobalt-zinc-cadmium efflux system membrane fusion protein